MSKKENGDIRIPDIAIFRYNCFVGLLRCVAPISLASKDARAFGSPSAIGPRGADRVPPLRGSP